MAAPLSRILFDQDTRRVRDIDNHYHLEMIAQNSDEVVEYQRHAMRIQAAAAATNLRALGEVARRQDQGNAHLGSLQRGQREANVQLKYLTDGQKETNQRLRVIAAGLDGVRGELELSNKTLDDISEVGHATLDAVYDQTEAIRSGFVTLANHLLEQKAELKQIASTLRRPYEAQMLELREQADIWLTNGMRNRGRERNDDWNDAMRLLREVTKNPVGNQDYVTWFQIGWLTWKHEKRIDEAAEAFYRAGRLSAPRGDLYHALSIRHLAYMQYLCEKYEDAYQTVQRVVREVMDHDAPFDAARYAARTGRKAEAIQLLEKCIDLVPTTIITMFAEEDFQG